MAFTDSHRRCASFGIATNLPDDVIDSIWYIIDHFLKHVFELEDELEFRLLNRNGSITFRFSSQHLPTIIDFDFTHPFEPENQPSFQQKYVYSSIFIPLFQLLQSSLQFLVWLKQSAYFKACSFPQTTS